MVLVLYYSIKYKDLLFHYPDSARYALSKDLLNLYESLFLKFNLILVNHIFNGFTVLVEMCNQVATIRQYWPTCNK